MATGKTTVTTGSKVNGSPSHVPAHEESQIQVVSDRKQDEVPGGTTSKDQVEPILEENKQKPDAFNEWRQKVVRDFEQIKPNDKKKLDPLKNRVIQVEEKFESVREGYSINSRLEETENAIDNLKKRLKNSDESSGNVPKNISVSQESVLKKFEDIYAEWNKKWSTPDRDCDLCKIHEKCHNICKKQFEKQMNKLLEVARPLSRDQSSNDAEDKQIIEEVYKELARNTVETDLEKVKVEGRKEIKNDKELKMFDKELKMFVPECLELCWITLLLKEPLLFEFDCQNAKEGTFEGTTQDKMAIVIKPAILTDKDEIKICGKVRQRPDDANKKEDKNAENNAGVQTEDHASSNGQSKKELKFV